MGWPQTRRLGIAIARSFRTTIGKSIITIIIPCPLALSRLRGHPSLPFPSLHLFRTSLLCAVFSHATNLSILPPSPTIFTLLGRSLKPGVSKTTSNHPTLPSNRSIATQLITYTLNGDCPAFLVLGIAGHSLGTSYLTCLRT